jgi:hypothetical protein
MERALDLLLTAGRSRLRSPNYLRKIRFQKGRYFSNLYPDKVFDTFFGDSTSSEVFLGKKERGSSLGHCCQKIMLESVITRSL